MNDLYKDSSVFFAAANTHAGFKSLFDDIFMKNAELDRIYGEPITFMTCPTDEKFFTDLYEMIFSYLND